MQKILLFLLTVCLSFNAFAQQIAVSGKVLDETGQPLVGAVIKVKGGTGGTSADVNGNFTISVSTGTTLIVSYITYQTKEVAVTAATKNLSIILAKGEMNLEQVVVVAYGTQKKTSVTGSVASVSSAELNTTKNQNVQNMLTGKVPGLRVIQPTSEPGTFSNQFDIRGFTSPGGNGPLVVIDGVPRTGTESRLDPNDIENISVLKDAAAAIYGARGANGVVLITTKSGKSGRASIEYQFYTGFQKPSNLTKPLDAIGRFTILNERSMHNINSPVPAFADDIIAPYLNGTKQSTDWYDKVMKSSSPQSQHTLSASGGSDNGKITYFMNLGYLTQGGLWKSNDLNYKKYNFRSNLTAQVTNSLKANINISGIYDQQDRPNQDSWIIFKNLQRAHPDDPYYANNNPQYLNKILADFHPGAIANSDISGYRKNINKIFQGQFSLEYAVPFIKGLTAKGQYSYDVSTYDNTAFQKIFNVYDYNVATKAYTPTAYQTPNSTINRAYGNAPNTLLQLTINYSHTFNQDHELKLLGVFEEETNKTDAFQAQRNLTILLPYLFAGNAAGQLGFNNANNLRDAVRKSMAGRINYSYKSRYLAEVAFRRDGSSLYPPSQKWGFFPSGSLGWRVSEETFMKNSKALSFITNLKLRASYALLGSDGGLNFQHLAGYDYPYAGNSQALANGYLFDAWTNSLGFRVLPTPNFTWYDAKILNLGLDADIKNGLLGITLDVFRRNGNGIPATRSVSLPASFGATIGQEPLNSDQTKGAELALTHRNKIGKDFSYNIAANVAYTRTKMRYVERGRDGNSYLNWRNNPTNRYNDVWFGLGYIGQYDSYNQIANYPVYTGRATLPGDYIYQDWNGDGTIDDLDRHPIATTINPNGDANGAGADAKKNYPLLTFGFNVNLNYKNFDLNMLLQGGAISYISYGELYQNISENAYEFYLDRWHPQDPKKDPYDPTNVWIPGYNAYSGTVYDINSERGIQNGAYLRFKTIELGYTLPNKWISKIGIRGVRVYANGYNLITFTGARGVDPEHPSNLFGYIYPLNKTVNFGANIRF